MPTEEERRVAAATMMLIIIQATVNYRLYRRITRRSVQRAPRRSRDVQREDALSRMYLESDHFCHKQLRMKRAPFQRLCAQLRDYGLVDGRSVKVEEQVAIFLLTVGHDLRNRNSMFHFSRSGETISRYFHIVLSKVLMLYTGVVKPITSANSPADGGNPQAWYHYFKDAVGVIDSTRFNAHVPVADQPQYRNRSAQNSQNVLLACTFDMKFTYVFAGSEDSDHDACLLRSALIHPESKLTLPDGKYYLADASFPCVPGFLTPYRSVRYHLHNQVGQTPEDARELYNFRHSSLHNVVERAIKVMKKRFSYLRNLSFHDVETQTKIILACCALHNFLRNEDPTDMCEEDPDGDEEEQNELPEEDAHEEADIVIDSSPQWLGMRDTLAQQMWLAYRIQE